MAKHDETIKVQVVEYGHGRNLMMRYVDPLTMKQVGKSSGTRDLDAALKAAGKWEDELNNGRYKRPTKITWSDARKRYEAEKVATLASASGVTVACTMNVFERTIGPARLASVTGAVMSRFAVALRDDGAKPATVGRHLRVLKGMLRWCVSQGMLHECPTVDMPKAGKGTLAKGRAVNGPEFRLMLKATAAVRPRDKRAWRRLLRGLWLSGLRLGEALRLSWDGGEEFWIDRRGKRPVFRIAAEGQKSRRDEVVPLTPDFAAWIMRTPEEHRTGHVFPLVSLDDGRPIASNEVGRIVSMIGVASGVVVNRTTRKVRDKKTGKVVESEVVKYASAHDLRRAFCTRWAKRVMPAVLKKLARHADLSTTMRYYVDLDADEMAEQLWQGHGGQGNTPGNTRPETKPGDRQNRSVSRRDK